jgi:hypothetical protein
MVAQSHDGRKAITSSGLCPDDPSFAQMTSEQSSDHPVKDLSSAKSKPG